MTIKSILAWLSRPFTKGKTMNVSVPLTALVVGATTVITATEAATFAASNESILTVDASGLVTGVAEGDGSIVVTSVADPSQTSTINFTVTASALGESTETSSQSASLLISKLNDPVSSAPAAKTEFEKLEELIDKLELSTVKEVKAAITFIRALA